MRKATPALEGCQDCLSLRSQLVSWSYPFIQSISDSDSDTQQGSSSSARARSATPAHTRPRSRAIAIRVPAGAARYAQDVVCGRHHPPLGAAASTSAGRRGARGQNCISSMRKDLNPHLSSGQPHSRAYCSSSRCPPSAANRQVCSSHGHPCARAYCSTDRCPPAAAIQHVCSSHAQPCSCR